MLEASQRSLCRVREVVLDEMLGNAVGGKVGVLVHFSKEAAVVWKLNCFDKDQPGDLQLREVKRH